MTEVLQQRLLLIGFWVAIIAIASFLLGVFGFIGTIGLIMITIFAGI